MDLLITGRDLNEEGLSYMVWRDTAPLTRFATVA